MKRSLLGLVLVAATAALAVPASVSRAASIFPGGPYFDVVCGFSHRVAQRWGDDVRPTGRRLGLLGADPLRRTPADPPAHRNRLLRIRRIFLYPPVPKRAQVASGRYGGHADFMNGWDQGSLARFVAGLND